MFFVIFENSVKVYYGRLKRLTLGISLLWYFVVYTLVLDVLYRICAVIKIRFYRMFTKMCIRQPVSEYTYTLIEVLSGC